MATSEYEQCLKSCIDQNEHVIRKLSELAAEVEHHHTVCNTVKTGGTTAGVAGTGLMVGSLLAAPFTGGASLAITLAAAGCSIGGAATNIITGMVDRSKSKEIIGEIQSLVNSREKVAAKVKEQSDYFERVVRQLVSSGMTEENAVNITFSALANAHVDLREAAFVDGTRTTLVTFGRIIQIECDILKTFQATIGAIPALAKALPGSHQLILKSVAISAEEATKLGLVGGQALKAGSEAVKAGGRAAQVGGQVLKTGGQAMGVAKTLATAAVVTSVVISVIDVAFLIRDWTSDHPTIAVIENIRQQLKDETDNFRRIRSTIDSFRNRVYLVIIDGHPIIGSLSAANDAMIALLNQDLPRCIEIFQKLDIEWPFERRMTEDQIVRFLIQHLAASGYDEERLKTILRKRGKSASTSITCLVQEIVAVVKERARSAAATNQSSRKSIRGEHVINNNVLSVQRDIIDMFLRERFGLQFGQMTRIPPESSISRAYHQPFSIATTNNIQNVMIARMTDDVFYFDTNAVVYGILIYILRHSAKNHMQILYDNQSPQGTPHTAALRTTRFLMNQMRIYVDDYALNYWLTYNGGSQATFESSRVQVYEMFAKLDDQIRIWVSELRRFGY